MLREGSDPLYHNFAEALLFRPMQHRPRDVPLDDQRGRRYVEDKLHGYQVLAFIRAQADGCKLGDVIEHFKCTERSASNHLRRLLHNGEIYCTGRRRNFIYRVMA